MSLFKALRRTLKGEKPFWQNSIFGALDVLYLITHLLALAPFGRYFCRKANCYRYVYLRVQVKNILPLICKCLPKNYWIQNISTLFSSLGLIFVIIALSLLNYKVEIKDVKSKSTMNILRFTFTCSNAVTLLVGPVMFLLREEEFLRAFCIANETDNLFLRFDKRFSYRSFNRLTMFLTVFMITSCIGIYEIIMETAYGISFVNQFPVTLTYCGSYICRQVPIYYYFTFVVLVISKLRNLNQIVSRWRTREMEKEELKRNLDVFARIYAKVFQFSYSMNSCCSILMLFNIIMSSMTMLLCVAYCFEKDEKRGVEVILWTLVNLPFTWGIICFVHYAQYLVIISIFF